MSAADAMTRARAAGIQIGIDGDALVLEAPAPPPAELLDLLARHKAAIVTLLRRANDGWSGEDWRELFEERAAIAEFDGGLPREQAAAQAFFCCVSQWLRGNPVRSPVGRCAYCTTSRPLLLPYLTDCSPGDPGHSWLHQECSQQWHEERRQKAIVALVGMGIASPVKFADDFDKNGSA